MADPGQSRGDLPQVLRRVTRPGTPVFHALLSRKGRRTERAGEEKHHNLFSSPALFVLKEKLLPLALQIPLVEIVLICYTLHKDL